MEVAALICVGWVLSVCLHEWGHAIVAYMGGDTTVKDKGYLTLNIFRYTDPGMTLFFPVLILMLGGIALPGAAVYINHRKLRNRFWESAVSAAGPAMSSLVAVVLAAPFWMHWQETLVPSWLFPGLGFLILLEVFSVILNSLPLPPCDGFGVIEPWLPTSIRAKCNEFGRYGIWVLFALLWFVQPVNDFFWAISYTVTELLGVPPQATILGYQEFHHNSGLLVIGLLVVFFLMRKKDKGQPNVDQLYNEARAAFANNRPDQTVAFLDRALKIQPECAEAWHLRGLALAVMNKSGDAMASFDRAIEIRPNYADCLYNKACCLALQGQNDMALANLQQAIAINPQAIKEHAKQDVGFKKLWNDDRFVQLVQS